MVGATKTSGLPRRFEQFHKVQPDLVRVSLSVRRQPLSEQFGFRLAQEQVALAGCTAAAPSIASRSPSPTLCCAPCGGGKKLTCERIRAGPREAQAYFSVSCAR